VTSSRERDIEQPDLIKEGNFFTVRATVCFSRKIFSHIYSYFDLWFFINSDITTRRSVVERIWSPGRL